MTTLSKDEVTPTEAVIARLTVQNEELRREVHRQMEQLRAVQELLDATRKAAEVKWMGPI